MVNIQCTSLALTLDEFDLSGTLCELYVTSFKGVEICIGEEAAHLYRHRERELGRRRVPINCSMYNIQIYNMNNLHFIYGI